MEPVLPPPVAFARRGPFVGRQAELAVLLAAWERAGRGGVEIALITGPPGIGRTRLAAEVAHRARGAGAPVLWGRAEEGVPYRPVVEAFRDFLDAVPGERRGRLAATAGALAPLLPGLVPAPAGAPASRHRLFGAVGALLAEVARDGPVLLVLDDLDSADPATAALVGHLVQTVAALRVCILGTSREAAPRGGQTVVALGGLGVEEAGDLLGALGGPGGPEAAPIAAALHAATAGNPLFLREAIAHLADTGTLVGRSIRLPGWRPPLPADVGGLIRRRVGRLSGSAANALASASVLGDEFDVDLVAGLARIPEAQARGALEEAALSGLVAAVPRPGADRFAFSHPLVRVALYESLAIVRRRRLHRQAVEAIEAARGPAGEWLGPLAAHARGAGPLGDPSRAVDYSVRAGERSMGVLAHEDAAANWEAAAKLLEAGGDPRTLVEVLVRLGELMCATGLDPLTGTGHLRRALAIAERTGGADAARVRGALDRVLGAAREHP